MKKRLPDTTIYLDTSDFLITSDPNQTDIQVSERVIVTENRDGTPKEQIITGKLNLSNGLSVTNGLSVANGVTVTSGGVLVTGDSTFNNKVSVTSDGINVQGDSVFYNNVTVGFNKISQISIQSTSIFTKKLYSTFNALYQSSDDYFSEIELTSVATNTPGTIDLKVCYYYGTSTRKHVTYRLSNDGFYVIEPEPINSTSGSGNLGTSDHYWDKAYIKNIYGDSLQMNQIEGNVSSLYNLVIGGQYPMASPGSLFLAQSFCSSNFRVDRSGGHASDNPINKLTFYYNHCGCMCIRILEATEPQDTSIETIWNRYFSLRTIIFHRGIINNIVCNRITVHSVSDIYTYTYYVFYEEETARFRIEVDIGEGERVIKLWFALKNMNTNPLLYNGLYVSQSNKRSPLINPCGSYNRHVEDEAIDFQRWRIAFLGEVSFSLQSNVPEYTRSGDICTFNYDIQSEDDIGFDTRDTSTDTSIIVGRTSYTVPVMKVGTY